MSRTAIALGLFDGVHLGHRAVLGAAAARQPEGLLPAAFTFQPEFAGQKGAVGFLYTAAQREEILREECGIPEVLSLSFAQVGSLSGEEFVRGILCERMNAVFVVCGENFRFGRGAAWNADALREFGRRYGFAVQVVPAVCKDGGVISSSRIRSLLSDGRICEANALLGAPYQICGKVLHGAHLGHTIGFPTINQNFAQGQLVPHFGVYASETITAQGCFLSVTDIGVKPTVGYSGLPLAETHILDFSGDLYGQVITVRLLHFLREEQRFHSLDALRSRLSADADRCRQLSGNYHGLNT